LEYEEVSGLPEYKEVSGLREYEKFLDFRNPKKLKISFQGSGN